MVGSAGLPGKESPQLGGSWVVISRVISPLIWLVTLLITPLITTHELLRRCRNSVMFF